MSIRNFRSEEEDGGNWMPRLKLAEQLVEEKTRTQENRYEHAIKRAVGMIQRPQLAKDEATLDLTAYLMEDDAIKNMLADGNWSHAADLIAHIVIDAYHRGLER